MTRALALVVAVAVLSVGVFAALTWVTGDEEAAPVVTATQPEPLRRLLVIFPEGFNVREMAARVAAVREIAITRRKVTPRLTRAAYLRAIERALPPSRFRADVRRESVEGFLFPASYEFTQETSARELVADQLAAFRARFRGVDLAYARSKNLTPYDVLIIASMIEKETAVPRERRLVAAVIYNRLRNRMPLGIDATIRYGLGIPGTESLTKAALRSTSPYNTRLRPGLPPTPIANPGLASLKAAASPTRGVDFLYYVRKPRSLAHYFTANESDFLRKVCDYGYACD